MSDTTIETEPDTTGGMDRRSALKKAALAAGVVGWTTPAVQALTPGTASAQTPYSNCGPNLQYQLLQTGSNCKYLKALGSGIDPNCCNEHTYAIVVPTANCGATCSGNIIGGSLGACITAVTANGQILFKGKGCINLADSLNCSASRTMTVTVRAFVKCQDGRCWDCTDSATFQISDASGNCVRTANAASVTRNCARIATCPTSPPGCAVPATAGTSPTARSADTTTTTTDALLPSDDVPIVPPDDVAPTDVPPPESTTTAPPATTTSPPPPPDAEITPTP